MISGRGLSAQGVDPALEIGVVQHLLTMS
jgi:hypothetical protein